jgi:glycosyltransferase involved in cell wall biosynthesis
MRFDRMLVDGNDWRSLETVSANNKQIDEPLGERSVGVVFNRYLTRGGEEAVFELEADLLRRHGWDVVELMNAPTAPHSVPSLLKLGIDTVWSGQWYRKFRDFVRIRRLPLVHIHNTFPGMSPAICHAAKQEGAAVVHSLHNYRLICPNAICYRDNHPCEDCVGRRLAWPGVVHRCYRDSRVQTAGVSSMLAAHRWLKTWERKVDVFVACTEFQRQALVRGGIPGRKIVVKPNFTHPVPGEPTTKGEFCLFVGRLATQKGVMTLFEAWRHLQEIPLKVIGDHPSEVEARKIRMVEMPNLEILGRRTQDEVFRLMKQARFLILPSEWYEGFPVTVLEAFACGLPIVASRIGGLVEIVDDGRTGLHFTPGDPHDLAAKVKWAWSHRQEMMRMGTEARGEYETKYTPDRNYRMLTEIYEMALNTGQSRG